MEWLQIGSSYLPPPPESPSESPSESSKHGHGKGKKRKRKKERHRSPPPAPPLSVENSKYHEDRKGSRENLEFGGLYRGDVPTYIGWKFHFQGTRASKKPNVKKARYFSKSHRDKGSIKV
ncbi:unnamed protein product [Chrysoparadoxa australica]